MPDNRLPIARSRQILAKLASPARLESFGPIAARFAFSLRLIALHQRANRDPVPELATRLGRIEVAARTLALSQAITQVWPENIHVSRFCCKAMTHDEATIGAMIEAATDRDREAFDAAAEGLIRPARIETLWDAATDLVMAELQAA